MSRGVHTLLASALLSVIALVPADAAQPHPDKDFDKARFAKEVLQSKDLPNFHKVHPYLYRSGEPTEVGFKKLPGYGIKTVIDLRAPTEKAKNEAAWAKSTGIKYVNLPMSSEPPTEKQVKTFMEEVKRAKANPTDGSVLVHCAHGSDRTGCLVGIWRVTEDGWDYPKAYKEMRHYWFTPKFTKLSGAVEKAAAQKKAEAKQPAAATR